MLFRCGFKEFLGFECPLCGGQRSLVLLMNGHFQKSFLMYPPLIPALLLIGLFCLHLYNREWVRRKLLINSSIVVLVIIMVNYIFTLAWGHLQ